MFRFVGAVTLAWCAVLALRAQTSQPVEYEKTAIAVCELRDARITEASGIVPSHRNPGCYYVHNDSGDEPRVFLIDRTGQTRLTIRLKHAAAVDYEDIALAPGTQPGTFDVCAADIGDNAARRPYVIIYRFPEVELRAGQPATIEVEPSAYRFRYADGPADAEALFVHPRTGDGYIVTKRTDGSSAVYKLPAPWDAKQETTLTRLLTLELPPSVPPARIVTAADIAPDGQRVAVRCYTDGWEWRLPPGTPDSQFERIFRTKPILLSLPAEPQGEALCYAADGRSILTISEGQSPTLYEVRALTPTSAPGPGRP
jgi:hypothetical protein